MITKNVHLKSNLLLLGGLGVGAYFLTRGFNTLGAVKRLEYTNPKIKVGKFSLGGLALEMKLDFVNHSSEGISIEYFSGNIIYEGNTIAGFLFNANGKNQLIAARSTTTIPFTVVVKTFGAITVISRLIQALSASSRVNSVVTVDGAFYAAGIDVPVNFDYDLKAQAVVSSSKQGFSKN